MRYICIYLHLPNKRVTFDEHSASSGTSGILSHWRCSALQKFGFNWQFNCPQKFFTSPFSFDHTYWGSADLLKLRLLPGPAYKDVWVGRIPIPPHFIAPSPPSALLCTTLQAPALILWLLRGLLPALWAPLQGPTTGLY